MNIGHEGFRKRYFHERAKVEAQVGNPIRREVTADTRARLVREIRSMTDYQDDFGQWKDFEPRMFAEINRVLDANLSIVGLARCAERAGTEEFLTILEIAVDHIWRYRKSSVDVLRLQSLLTDDLSAYRFDNVGSAEYPSFQIILVDNEHLHTEIVDRTFELTREAAFASAQRDYAEAWKHYRKGDADDALVNAHKAVESAMKLVIKRVDPMSTPENMQTNQLVPLLVQLDVLPSRLQNLVVGLNQIFMNSGSLRNSAGTGHGSVDLSSPEATVALMALRMSGTLVSFLVDRYEQMKPKAAKPAKAAKPKA